MSGQRRNPDGSIDPSWLHPIQVSEENALRCIPKTCIDPFGITGMPDISALLNHKFFDTMMDKLIKDLPVSELFTPRMKSKTIELAIRRLGATDIHTDIETVDNIEVYYLRFNYGLEVYGRKVFVYELP